MNQMSPMAEAMKVVSKITGIGLTFVLPIIAGNWLDNYLGTYWLGITGVILGFVVALISITGFITEKKK
jgi:hypothetical protein